MKRKVFSVFMGLLFLSMTVSAATWYTWRYRTHATDCTSLTDGKARDLCFEIDDEVLYKCETGDGLCNTAGEWKLVSGVTASANIDDNTLVRGDGGAEGVQGSGVSLDDSDNMTLPTGADLKAETTISTPEVDQNITAITDTLSSSATHVQLNPNADYIMTSTPTIAAGVEGQLLILENISTFDIDLQDDSVLAGSDVFLGRAEGTIAGGGVAYLFYTDDSGGGWRMLSNPNTASLGADATLLEVRNATGVSIAAGKPVYIAGYNVGQGRPLIALADADDAAKMPAIGIVVSAIANGSNGDVITSGSAVNIIDTSGQAVNDPVYVGTTAGGLVFTRPTGATTAIQRIGTVVRVHVNNGVIIVTGAGRQNDEENITEAYIFVGNANEKPVAVAMGGDATISANGTVTVGDDSHDHVIANIDSMTSEALFGQISDETGSASGSPLAVFNVNPLITDIELSGASILANASASGILTLGGIGGSFNENWTIGFNASSDRIDWGTSSGATRIFNPSLDLIFGDNIVLTFGNGSDTHMTWETTGNDNMQIGTRVGGATGSGYYSLMDRLDMRNANRSPTAAWPAGATSANPVLGILSSDATVAADGGFLWHDQDDFNIASGTGGIKLWTKIDSTTGLQILDSDGGVPILNVDTENERVGIGTDSPGAKLDIFGEHVSGVGIARFKGAAQFGFISVDTTTSGEAGFLLSTAGTLVGQFGISGNKVFIKNRVFGTAGLITLSDTGNVGISAVSPDGKLSIGGDSGSQFNIKTITEEITIPIGSGFDPVVTTSGNLAPAGSLIMGVVFRVTDAPGGGATVIDIGRTGGGNLDEFIDGVSCDVLNETGDNYTNGDTAHIGIQRNISADTFTLTTDADVTGDEMKVRIVVFYRDLTAPTS